MEESAQCRYAVGAVGGKRYRGVRVSSFAEAVGEASPLCSWEGAKRGRFAYTGGQF